MQIGSTLKLDNQEFELVEETENGHVCDGCYFSDEDSNDCALVDHKEYSSEEANCFMGIFKLITKGTGVRKPLILK